MKKADMLRDIEVMLEKMTPELRRLGITSQFKLDSRSIDLLAPTIKSAHDWLVHRFKGEWKEAHHFYKRHKEDSWDNLLDSTDTRVLSMNEVKGWLTCSIKLRKALKKRPDLFKDYEVIKLLKPKQKRGRKPNVK